MKPGRAALLLLCAADLVVMLDGMVVTVALPAIQQDLGTRRADLQWIVTAYTLSLGAFLLIGGRAGDLYGRRRVLVTGLAVFAVASLVAGLARSTAPLLAARAAQGIGAALCVPAALALLSATYREQRAREWALGRLSATLDVGMVAGLVLGGVLTASLGWPWCFFVVVPVGLAAAALAPSVLEESRDDDAPRRLDLPGAVLAAAGCGLVAFGLVRMEHGGPAAALPAVAGLALLGAFVAWERRVPAPLVRLAVLRHRPLTGANLSVAANAGSFGAMMFLATLYMQQELRFSAMEAGLAFLPLALSAGAGGLAAPRIVERVGPRRTATISLMATAASFLALTQLPGDDGYLPVMLPAFLVAGFSFASAFVTLSSQAMTGVREGEKGLASGLFGTSTHLGGALVLALVATTEAGSGFPAAYLVAAAILVLGALAAAATLPAPDRRLRAGAAG
jgi:EmrB/QacA subfamily drug resistance transporter